MGQPKGKTGNPNGRPKGTPNKVTTTLKEWIIQLIDGNREQIERDFKQLSARDRLLIFERLLPYVIPKQQSISGIIENLPTQEEKGVDLSFMSTEDLRTIVDIFDKYPESKRCNYKNG